MGYIFTEYFFDFFSMYLNITIWVNNVILFTLALISSVLPYAVKYVIGYCHFYYQLGYGLIFYIYIYRRRKAKKTNDWSSFYGESASNWVFFNISVFNKFVFSRAYVTLIKQLFITTYLSAQFMLVQFFKKSISTRTKLINFVKKNLVLYNWTPLFKRTSYISFFTFLKRFSKRK